MTNSLTLHARLTPAGFLELDGDTPLDDLVADALLPAPAPDQVHRPVTKPVPVRITVELVDVA